MQDYIKDRNEAFASMDEEKIKAYCKKYKIAIPEDKNIFWIGVHKVICNLYTTNSDSPITLEQYNKSQIWLARHGASPTLY